MEIQTELETPRGTRMSSQGLQAGLGEHPRADEHREPQLSWSRPCSVWSLGWDAGMWLGSGMLSPERTAAQLQLQPRERCKSAEKRFKTAPCTLMAASIMFIISETSENLGLLGASYAWKYCAVGKCHFPSATKMFWKSTKGWEGPGNFSFCLEDVASLSLNLKIAFRVLINLSEGSSNELERKNETKQSLRVCLTAKSGLGVAECTLLPKSGCCFVKIFLIILSQQHCTHRNPAWEENFSSKRII